jgi:ElaB/YqjD/DUF883 family membrane-anchored ribosome-binding protein
LKPIGRGNFRHNGALPAHEWPRFEELSMSITNGETQMKNLTEEATYERLQKDVTAVKNDIAALTDQITDALNAFAGTAQKQARRGYKQARANVDSALDDASERGGAMYEAAQDAAHSIEESLEDVIAQRPLATVGIALGLGFVIGAIWRR